MTDNFPSTWAEINLVAIAHNIRVLRRGLSPQTKFMAVVKANAYGHGAVAVARAALGAGAEWLAVARVGEGAELRAAGITAPIFLLGPMAPAEAAEAVHARLTVAIGSLRTARALAEASRAAGVVTAVHLKIDTGMSRFGLPRAEALRVARALAGMEGLRLEGVFTHFAAADDADQTFTRLQVGRYRQALSEIEGGGIAVAMRHAANSAGMLADGGYQFDLVRGGIALYGICPYPGLAQCDDLRPALSLKSRVAFVRAIGAGDSVGYNRAFVSARAMRVALVSIGYADGVRRALSNKGEALIRGTRARMLGRVSMDQIVVDADACGAQEGDEVVLIGRQGEAQISAEEVATWAGTVAYEVLTGIGARVVRTYVKRET